MNGKCHLCGEYKELTFEHVPPRRAFNARPAVIARFDEIMGAGSIEELEGIRSGDLQRKGVGRYTLCGKCNNDTGGWYGRAYVEWAYQGLVAVESVKGYPYLGVRFRIYPLRVLKQIVCMFFSATHAELRDVHPELVQFALNKEERSFPSQIGIYVALTKSPTVRQSGVTGKINLLGPRSNMNLFSEISYPPFTYMMTIDSNPTESRFVNINWFAEFKYPECKNTRLLLPILPVHSPLPGDFRTRDQVAAGYNAGI